MEAKNELWTMSVKKHSKLSSVAMAHLNELLDEALEETFPASDPIAVTVEIASWQRIFTASEEDDRLKDIC